MGRGEPHRATVQICDLAGIVLVQQRIDPQTAQIERDAVMQGDRRRAVLEQHLRGAAVAAAFEVVVDGERTATCGHIRLEIDHRRVEIDPATVGQGHRPIDGDRVRGADIEPAKMQCIDVAGIKPCGTVACGCQRVGSGQARRDEGHIAEADIRCVQTAAAKGGAITAETERALQRGGVLYLLVAIGDIGRARRGLARALDDVRDDVSFHERGRRREVETAGIAADGVTVLPAPRGGAVEHRAPHFGELVGDLALDVVRAHEAARRGDEPHAGRGVVEAVDAAVGADQLAGIDPAAIVIHRSAGDVEPGTLLRNNFRSRKRDSAADRGPFADGMRGVGKIAADFEQPAFGVVALAGIAAGAGRDEDEIANVDPDILVEQRAAIAIDRRVAQFIALNIDLHLVRRHRPHRALHTGDIDDGAGLGENAFAGADRDLAALCRRI